MRKLILILLLASLGRVFAQTGKPVLAILPFEHQGVSLEETKTIEKLVQSYISEFDDFRLLATDDRDRVLSEREFAVSVQTTTSNFSVLGDLLSADFLLSGSIGAVADNRIITLEVVKVKTSEKKSASSVHRSMSELALETRALVLKLFEKAETSTTALIDSNQQTRLTEADIIGSWRGDKGLETVRILRGGKAYALLTSNTQMELTYTIDNEEVRFVQSSPNSLLFYHPVPYKIALQLENLARPMEWRFSLTAKGMVLRGIKTSTAVRYEQDRIIELLHGSTREAEWTKLSQ